MNVASLDLCKELYKLSGWRDGGFEYTPYGDVIKVSGVSFKAEKTGFYPAYDLGYLLRKLPKEYGGDSLGLVVIDPEFGSRDGMWECGYEQFFCNADTPEDAAAKLCIELIKQKVITPEQEK